MSETGKPLDRCVVDRSRWIRGVGPKESCLLRADDGRMCCVGFYAKQVLRLNDEQIRDEPTLPDCVENDVRGAAWRSLAYAHNDEPFISDREAKLQIIFREHLNCELTFVDGEVSS